LRESGLDLRKRVIFLLKEGELGVCSKKLFKTEAVERKPGGGYVDSKSPNPVFLVKRAPAGRSKGPNMSGGHTWV